MKKLNKSFSTVVLGLGILTLSNSAQAINFGNIINPSKCMGGSNRDRYTDYGSRPGYGHPGGWGGGPGYGGPAGWGSGPGYSYGGPSGWGSGPGYGYGGPGGYR